MKLFKALRDAGKYNINQGCCPNCFHYDVASVKATVMRDKLERDWKIYLHCTNCSFTTPAFEDIEKASDNLEDAFIEREYGLFMG